MTTTEPDAPNASPSADLDAVAALTIPTDVPPAIATWLHDDTVLEQLLAAVLDAAYPNDENAEPGVLSTATLSALTASGAPGLEALYLARTKQAARILGAVADHLYQLWDARRADDEVTQLDVPRDAQHVTRHTLRKWAVAADLVADRAEQRLVPAAHGARWLADQIRRELTHPADVPALAADRFEPDGLFDRRRAEPEPAPADVDG